jgi:hypothetical protein
MLRAGICPSPEASSDACLRRGPGGMFWGRALWFQDGAETASPILEMTNMD